MIEQSLPSVGALVNQALLFHQRGDLENAERSYLQVTSRDPRNADALHLLGVLKGQRGDHAAGLRLIADAISQRPRVSAYHNNLGNLLVKAGNLTDAEKSYRRALRIEANNADAHLNLGKLLHDAGSLTEARRCLKTAQRLGPRSLEAQMSVGRLEEQAANLPVALSCYRAAAAVAPHHAPAQLAIGNVLRASGQSAEAEAAYLVAIALDPAYADAYFNLANTLRSRGALSESVSAYRKAATLSPSADVFNNLGVALAEMGLQEESTAALLKSVVFSSGSPQSSPVSSAEGFFNLGLHAARSGDSKAAEDYLQQALAIDTNHPGALLSFANLRRTTGQPEAAVTLYRRLIAIAPETSAAHNNLAATLDDLELHAEALVAYREALRLAPDSGEALFNLGKHLTTFSTIVDEALGNAYLHQALAIDPTNAPTLTQLGVVAQNRGLLAEAASFYRRSLAIEPASAITRGNLGLVLASLGNPEGLNLLQSAVEADPTSPEAHWALSEKLLLHGQLTQGWQEYEWRKQVAAYRDQHPAFTQPLWQGQPLEGQTILLHAEQGQGDTIQFARYAPLVAELGGRVILQVQPSLKRLLTGIPGVALTIGYDDPRPAFDTYAPLMSLPHLLRTTSATIPPAILPANVPAAAARTSRNLQVGIVWAGNTKDKRDRLRSTQLSQWSALASIPGVDFTSLQAAAPAAQAAEPSNVIPFIADCSSFADFADTAALIAGLDLVITVDTAVAHLASTLGKPTWILLYDPLDWRWGLHGETTPWYPTARLFRQSEPANWTPVLAAVETSLRLLTHP